MLTIVKCKDKRITCSTDHCFNVAKWFIEGDPYCEECKNRIEKNMNKKEN